MLGDNWYGELAEAPDPRDGKPSSKQMYPAKRFPLSSVCGLGNHDYQRWPRAKWMPSSEYARSGRTRWTIPPVGIALSSRQESADYLSRAR